MTGKIEMNQIASDIKEQTGYDIQTQQEVDQLYKDIGR